MCFIAVLFQAHPDYPLVVAANRNESRARPATAPYRWPDDTPSPLTRRGPKPAVRAFRTARAEGVQASIWAGRDEIAGGTWLGASELGFLVAITNRRDGPVDRSFPSRGVLCLDALREPSPSAALALVEERLRRAQYNPFNLLCGSPHEAWVTTWKGDTRSLSPGIHVITNAGDVDDRQIPAIVRAADALTGASVADAALDVLLDRLGRLCADTTEPDRICRAGGETGTVSSSLIALAPDGSLRAYRHADGPPCERPYADFLA